MVGLDEPIGFSPSFPAMPHLRISLLSLAASIGSLSLHAVAADDKPRTDPAFAPVEEVAGLPRVLLLGDSISIGYTLPVRELLKGKANVHRPPTNCSSTGNALKNLDSWLGEGKWDVIHFNFGLHDAKLPPEGVRHAPPEIYGKNLRELVGRLRATGAALVWATTTPVPNGGVISPTRRFGSIEEYNAVARKVMEGNGVRVNDLNALIAPRLATLQKPNDVHFTEAGSEVLAGAVAKAIGEALSESGGKQAALPFDPAVISRLSLDGVPRSLAICQGGSTWLGYDLERALVFKVWQAPAGKAGLSVSGFVTRSLGEVRFEDKAKAGWEWRGEGGDDVFPLKIRYLGCSQREDGFELSWDLQGDKTRLRLRERIALAAPSGGVAMRELRVEGLGEGESLLLPSATRSQWDLRNEIGEPVDSLGGSGWHRLTLP